MNWVAHISSKHLKHHADLWQGVLSNPEHVSFSYQNSGGNWGVTTECSFQHKQNQFLNQTSAFSICDDLLLHLDDFFTSQFLCGFCTNSPLAALLSVSKCLVWHSANMPAVMM